MVVIDQVTKGWADASLRMGTPGANFGLFEFDLVHNTGAAFGMGQGASLFFVVIACATSVLAVVWLAQRRKNPLIEVLGLSLVVAGGIGNCVDRLVTGYVVDFIKLTFIDFPVFNIADICVTCGVILFLIAIVMLCLSPEERAGGSEGQ